MTDQERIREKVQLIQEYHGTCYNFSLSFIQFERKTQNERIEMKDEQLKIKDGERKLEGEELSRKMKNFLYKN